MTTSLTSGVPTRMITTGDKLPRMAFVGNVSLDLNEITPIVEDPVLGKPEGGLWVSPVDENTGRSLWEHWVIDEDHYPENLKKHTELTIDHTANVLVFNDDDDFIELPDKYWSNTNSIKWSRIEEDYDAVYLTAKGNSINKSRMNVRGGNMALINAWMSDLSGKKPTSKPDKNNRSLGVWDIESMLIFDHAKDKVNIVSIADIVIKDKWDV